MRFFRIEKSSVFKKGKRIFSFLMILTVFASILLSLTASAYPADADAVDYESVVIVSSLKDECTNIREIDEKENSKAIISGTMMIKMNTSTAITSHIVKTDDEGRISFYIGVLLVAVGVVGFIFLKKKQKD